MQSSAYLAFKCLHVLGVVILLGNVTVTAVWKAFADRTRAPSTVAFAQRLVVGTDWAFTACGILLIIVGGYGMTAVAHVNPMQLSWLVFGQALFLISGLIWACVLLPIQSKQASLARTFEISGEIPKTYWILSRRWLVWGVVATVPLVAAVAVMIAKP